MPNPIDRIVEDIEDFFIGLGYEIKEGYEVEQITTPGAEPSKITPGALCRIRSIFLKIFYGHTSPVQARTLKRKRVKARFICPGKASRAMTLTSVYTD